MKEYKVVGTNKKRVEQIMNDMAEQGWEVVAVTFYYGLLTELIVTFSRDKTTKD